MAEAGLVSVMYDLVLQTPPSSVHRVHQAALNVRNLRNADNAPQLATRTIAPNSDQAWSL